MGSVSVADIQLGRETANEITMMKSLRILLAEDNQSTPTSLLHAIENKRFEKIGVRPGREVTRVACPR
jgi:hypothetical protein